MKIVISHILLENFGVKNVFLLKDTSENSEIDNFIKDIKQVGEGGFAKVYSAKWIDGQAIYEKQDDGSWKQSEPEPIIVALKRLNGSQNMSADYLNEVLLCLCILTTIFNI